MKVHLVDGTYELFRHFFATPVAVATDHVIESFRNDLWPMYKTGEGIDPKLREQFEPLDARDPRVEQVVICTPDKDLSQCVEGTRIVQLDRRKRAIRDEAGVIEKFGVGPKSIPDYLALVGDAADGYPGLPGWGAKSSAAVLAKYGHLENIPEDWREWRVNAQPNPHRQPRSRASLQDPRDDVDELRCSGPGKT